MFLPLHDSNALNHVRVQWMTLLLIAVNVVIWVVWSTPTISSKEAVQAAYLGYGYIPAVVNGYEVLPAKYVVLPEQASFITYAFFHSGFMHLAGNMLFLWVFGDNVEDAMGPFKFLLFYLGCAAAGAWMHGFVNPKSVAPLVGASGAAAGVVAAYLLLHPKIKIWVLMFGQIPLRISAMWVISAWIAFQVFELVYNSESEVAWGAHVGGIIAGALLILVMRSPGVPLLDQNLEGKLTVPPTTGTGAEVADEALSSKKKNTGQPSRWGRDGGRD